MIATRSVLSRGLTILQTFEDSGRSDLRLDGREALQAVMAGEYSRELSVKVSVGHD